MCIIYFTENKLHPLVSPQSEKSDLEALCQTKDEIIEARATENQQQAAIIRLQKGQLEQMEVCVSDACMLHIITNEPSYAILGRSIYIHGKVLEIL